MPSSNSSTAGFTLLETLVAITLMSFIIMLVSQGLRTGFVAWATIERNGEEISRTEGVRGLLRHTIAEAYPAFLTGDRNDRSLAFAGEQDALTLIAPLPAALAGGVLARQNLRTVGEGNNRSLILESQLDLPGASEGSPAKIITTKLLDHVGSLRLRYYGSAIPNQTAIWLEQWQHLPNLPHLVSVHLEPEQAGYFDWPDLIIELRRTSSVSCSYDPADLLCRRIE